MSRSETDSRRRLLRGEADREETAALVRAALLSGEDPAPWVPPETTAGSYDASLDRVVAAASRLAAGADADAAAAEGLVAELLELPAERRREAVETDARFHTWAAVAAVRQASFDACTDDPHLAVELAQLAVAALDGLAAALEPPSPAAMRDVADLRALALAQLGNALRVATDLRAAGDAMGRAFAELHDGTGDPLVRARLQSLGASLRSDQSRFDDALRLARRAAAVYRRFGDDHGYGRTLLKQASFHAYRDELREACDVLATALAHVDATAEPRLAFAAGHNRASYLDRLDRTDEAAAELARAEELCSAPLDRVRSTWLRGRIALHAANLHGGDPAAGEAWLWEARDAFLNHGIGYDAALVSLELAAFYAERGRAADQRRLAEEMVPIFASRDLHDEARAALRLYCDAASSEAVGLALVHDLAAYLERARHRPDLPFRR